MMFKKISNTKDVESLKVEVMGEGPPSPPTSSKPKSKPKPKAPPKAPLPLPPPSAPFASRDVVIAVRRLHYLSGMLRAGNNSPIIHQEIMQIVDHLTSIGEVSEEDRKALTHEHIK